MTKLRGFGTLSNNYLTQKLRLLSNHPIVNTQLKKNKNGETCYSLDPTKRVVFHPLFSCPKMSVYRPSERINGANFPLYPC